MEVGKPLRIIEVPKPEPIRIPFPVKSPQRIPVMPKRKENENKW